MPMAHCWAFSVKVVSSSLNSSVNSSSSRQYSHDLQQFQRIPNLNGFFVFANFIEQGEGQQFLTGLGEADVVQIHTDGFAVIGYITGYMEGNASQTEAPLEVFAALLGIEGQGRIQKSHGEALTLYGKLGVSNRKELLELHKHIKSIKSKLNKMVA